MILLTERQKDILEWVYCVIIAVIIAILIRYFIGTPTVVKQTSMYPTLKQDQRLWLNRWARTSKQDLKRGDIVTFEAPSTSYVPAKEADINNPIAKYEKNPKNIFSKFTYYVLEINKTSFIKRVIGLPGEKVKIENGKVYIDDKEIEEPYLDKSVYTDSLEGSYINLTVPDDCIFVMGDNRSQSTDSRRFGCIPIKKVESKVLFRFLPLDVFGKVK